MRVLGVLVFLLVVAPGAHARSGPCRTGDVPRVTAKQDATKVGYRYAVVACDARRRMRVLRRTRVRHSAERGALGRAITDAEISGRHVVWGELIFRRDPRRVRAVVVEADRVGRVQRRRAVRRTRASRDHGLDVAVLRDGSVAWNGADARVRLARPGRSARVVGPSYRRFLGSEDGRTLRWDRGDDRIHYRDVLPLPRRDGCPRRERFATLSSTAEHVVSRGGYDGANEDTVVGQVLRVCIRAQRRDPVVAQSAEDYIEVSLLAAGWAVIWGQASDTVLRATAGDRSTVLDRAAPGTITDLRADGETYRWRTAGRERSAPAP